MSRSLVVGAAVLQLAIKHVACLKFCFVFAAVVYGRLKSLQLERHSVIPFVSSVSQTSSRQSVCHVVKRREKATVFYESLKEDITISR